MNNHCCYWIVLINLVLNSLQLFSQDRLIYYDALTLLNGNDEQKKEVLLYYKVKQDNIYLKSYLTSDMAGLVSSQEPQSDVLGLNITNYVDGYAKFIVSRVKQELTSSYFEKFSKSFRNDKYKDVRTIFSSTCSELDHIGDKIYNYKPYLNDLRSAFLADIKSVPLKLDKLLTDTSSQLTRVLNKNPNVHYIAKNSFHIGLELYNGKHIGRIISEGSFVGTSGVDPALVFSLKTLKLFSEAFRAKTNSNTNNFWISRVEANNLIRDMNFLKVFIGLVAAKAEMDDVKLDGISLYSMLNGYLEINKLKQMVQELNQITNEINGIIKQEDTSKAKSNLSIYLNLSSDLLGSINNIFKTIVPAATEKNDLDLFINVINSIKRFNNGLVNKNYLSSCAAVTDMLTYLGLDMNESLAPLIKYGNFIGELTGAEDSDEISEIIESFAAPVGSWRDKKSNRWLIAIDNFVGPAFIVDNENFTLSTPVGLSITYACSEKFSLTCMASILDIGPLVSYRFLNSTGKVADIYFKEIISPGIFLAANFGRNCPIFFNIGYQSQPSLQRVGVQENLIDINYKSSIVGSININIPLLTIYRF